MSFGIGGNVGDAVAPLVIGVLLQSLDWHENVIVS